jgi:hypothetical protein
MLVVEMAIKIRLPFFNGLDFFLVCFFFPIVVLRFRLLDWD